MTFAPPSAAKGSQIAPCSQGSHLHPSAFAASRFSSEVMASGRLNLKQLQIKFAQFRDILLVEMLIKIVTVSVWSGLNIILSLQLLAISS